jgi:hypothetical protein
MTTEASPKKKAATQRLTDMDVSAVRLVPRGANGRNGMLLMKADDEKPASAPVIAPAPVTAPEPPAPFISKALALADGETLEDFRSDLCCALCALLNPGEIQGRNPWLRAVYEDRVIAQQGFDPDDKLLELPYTRTGEEFTFGEAKVVEEVTTYEPAQAEKTATEETPPAVQTTPPVAPAPAEVDKTAQQKLLLHRRVWELVHRTLDTILADNSAVADETPAAAVAAPEGASVDAAKTQPDQPMLPQTVTVKLPDALQKALEQVPALAAEVKELRATQTAMAKERGGSRALSSDPPPPVLPEPDWNGVSDINEFIAQQKRSRR